MSSPRTVVTGDILWADGTTDRFPPIVRARSGWWYKPYQAITDHRKTFGMGNDGFEAAKSWHTNLLVKALNQHKNEQPIRIGTALPETSINRGDSLVAAYMHPVYGQVELALKLYTSYGYRNSLHYLLSYHRMVDLGWQQNPDPWVNVTCELVGRYEVDTPDIEASLNTWERDPWNTTCLLAKVPHNVELALKPPANLLEPFGLRFEDKEQNFDGVRTYRSPKLRNYIGVEVRKILSQEMKSLESLAEALKYFGVTFNVQTRWEGHDKLVTGLVIQVPKSKHRGNEEGHEIGIRPDGVNVNCGYVKQEQRYHQYEIQKAKKILQGFDEETFETFEF